jgi:pimeloyl-ACP methyl ester carboxylesterase
MARPRFLSQETPRSGEQAALGADLLALMDSLSIEKAILGGYDWAGRAACIVAALWPGRGLGLASAGATYSSQDIVGAVNPGSPDREARDWYQYYFHTDRGRKGLTREPVDRTWRSAPQMQTRALTDNGLGVIQFSPGGAWSSYAPGQRQISRRQRLSAFHVP